MSSKRALRRRAERTHRRHACAGKIRHASLGDAEAHVRRLVEKDGARMKAYRCGFCGAFHVGHVPEGSS